jgi:hypothetical protein
MHPILSQAMVAERAREWEDRAARYRLAKQSRRDRRQAAQVTPGSPGPRGGSRWPAPRPAAAVPVAKATTVADDREPVAGRAA